VKGKVRSKIKDGIIQRENSFEQGSNNLKGGKGRDD